MSQHPRGQTTERKALCPCSLGSSDLLVPASDIRRAPTEKQTVAGKASQKFSDREMGNTSFTFGKHILKKILISKDLSEG